MKIKAKKALRKTKKYFINSWKKICWYIFKRAGIIVAIIVGFVVSMNLRIPLDIQVTIASSVILIVITADLLRFLDNITYFMENRRLTRPYKRATNITLYRWAEGIELEERFFFNILKKMSNGDAVKNLNSIKKIIKKSCSGNVSNLRLLKAYIERSISNNFLDKFSSIFLGILVGAITTIITKATSSNDFIQWINNHINGSGHDGGASYVLPMINYVTIFLILMLFITFVYRLFTRDKQRLKLISQIIDIAIMEIENKK